MLDFTTLGLDEVSPLASKEMLPPGKYLVKIIRSEENAKAEDDISIELRFEVQNGEHAKRWLFETLRLKHSSEKAVSYAKRALKSICEATGKPARVASDLLDRTLTVEVEVQPEANGYKARNSIRGYAAPPGAVAASAAPATAVKPAGAVRPWQRAS